MAKHILCVNRPGYLPDGMGELPEFETFEDALVAAGRAIRELTGFDPSLYTLELLKLHHLVYVECVDDLLTYAVEICEDPGDPSGGGLS